MKSRGIFLFFCVSFIFVILCVSAAGADQTGKVLGWGIQVVEGVDLDSGFTALAAGYEHSLGFKGDGSIVAWGWNDRGQCNVPAPNSGFIAVAAGGYHSLGLKADGSVVAWGWNEYGQCNVPAPNTGFIALAAGWYYSLGLKADGSIVPWGDNEDGQCNVPAPNSGFIALAAGWYHSLGIQVQGCYFLLAGDLNDDCRVDLTDLFILAAAWLDDYYMPELATLCSSWLVDCQVDPSHPACIPK